MRIPPASSARLQGPTTSTARFETARRNVQRARYELTAAALADVVLRVRTRHPDAARLLVICDDVEDGLYLAEITDRAGRPLDVTGALLDDRTTAQILGNIRGGDLASLPGVTHDRIAMAFAMEIDALPGDFRLREP